MMNNHILILSIFFAFAGVNHSVIAQPPELDNRFAPDSVQNKELLAKRLRYFFDVTYDQYLNRKKNINFAYPDGIEIYYFSREVQALVDMWRVTGEPKYLILARDRVKKAIKDGLENRQDFWWGDAYMGKFPCYVNVGYQAKYGTGHTTLFDIQAGYAFMLAARALKEAKMDGWEDIVKFVEENIIDKWLYRDTSIKKGTAEALRMIDSGEIVIKKMCSARDQREMFASICIDMHKTGSKTYPYLKWAKLLSEMYLNIKTDRAGKFTGDSVLKDIYPWDWGVVDNKKTGGVDLFISLNKTSSPTPMDTSHANRDAWLACQAYEEGFITKEHFQKFINTLKHQIRKKDKPGFYFANMVDGTDPPIMSEGPGQRGNIWFGWHRLAAYDDELKSLFVSMAYDITNGGPNITDGAFNKRDRMASLCLMAWGARLCVAKEHIYFP